MMIVKSKHELWNTWRNMKSRCEKPSSKYFSYYGSRGITVCERWQDFWLFVADMGNKPTPLHTIDRINVDGNYSPENCHWATRKEQARNKRNTAKVVVEGVEYLAADLADRCCVKTDYIISRARKGLPLERVLSPLRHIHKPGLTLGGKANGKRQLARTHCKRGHPFSEENLLAGKGSRQCKICHALRERERRKARQNAGQ